MLSEPKETRNRKVLIKSEQVALFLLLCHLLQNLRLNTFDIPLKISFFTIKHKDIRNFDELTLLILAI